MGEYRGENYLEDYIENFSLLRELDPRRDLDTPGLEGAVVPSREYALGYGAVHLTKHMIRGLLLGTLVAITAGSLTENDAAFAAAPGGGVLLDTIQYWLRKREDNARKWRGE